jgi:hypothetical protein
MNGAILAVLKRNLAEAIAHVRIGERNITKQRELMSRLERDGHGLAEARKLLAKFEELQAMYVAECDRLLSEIATNPHL